MPQWDQHSLRKHMHVYSSDNKELGHVADIYEDSFKIEKGLLFFTDRYLPYSAIASVDSDRVQLVLSADEVTKNDEWKRRPDYEDHPGDPTQLMYDRGHGVHDPFDEDAPGKP
jgi:hypothetical protein